MRIISGKYKGRRFNPPASLKARPTTDFAKEGLFNVLNNQIDIDNLMVLDLFGGSGSIAFEFVSRGAQQVNTVEKSYQHIIFIKKVMEQLGVKNLITIKDDVFSYLQHCTNTYDIIFADPPYALEKLVELPDIIFSKKLLSNDGVFILEHGKTHSFHDHEFFRETRQYGNVHFSFFKYPTLTL